MKKCFLALIATILISVPNILMADLRVINYTPIQYNIYIPYDGKTLGITATNPATTVFPDYDPLIVNNVQIYPHFGWPTITVGDPLAGFANIVTYSMIVPPMVTPFTVMYNTTLTDVVITFIP